jgi:CheY-like chemotaxis protein
LKPFSLLTSAANEKCVNNVKARSIFITLFCLNDSALAIGRKVAFIGAGVLMNDAGNSEISEYRKSVLLIDDDIDLIDRFKDVFEMEDFNVFTASNGKEALDMLKTMPESELPDLIMLDYMMPIMNGEKFSQVRQNDPRLRKIPVVLMTANGDLMSIMKKVHVNAYLEKPMDIENVLRVAGNFVSLQEASKKRVLH